MADEIENWARIERQFLREERRWLEAGGKVLSPSGEDITVRRIEQLSTRLEHAQRVLGDA